MASGHVNRSNGRDTWPQQPATRRKDTPCQLGAVPHGTHRLCGSVRKHFRCWRLAGRVCCGAGPSQFDPTRTSRRRARTGSASGVCVATAWYTCALESTIVQPLGVFHLRHGCRVRKGRGWRLPRWRGPSAGRSASHREFSATLGRFKSTPSTRYNGPTSTRPPAHRCQTAAPSAFGNVPANPAARN
jgi:hypothetical protein